MGANPRIAACSTVVFYWLRLFRSLKGKNYDADVKKLLPTLDIGSHINARFQARRVAEGRDERRLLAGPLPGKAPAPPPPPPRRRAAPPSPVPR